MDDCLERTESMVSMTKLKPPSEQEKQAAAAAASDSTNGGGGGLINQLISHLPACFGSEPPTATTAELNKEQEEQKEKDINNGGGLMDHLVSNLPSVSVPVSIPDDPAPDPEAASLLIHIVQD